ncbi:MAG: arsenate reductase (glutaredoxin) [Flavobacteriaceae bacterium]|nr:arsenate reductase (glutaredoxin) [Flavobacteriaceae bacterium]
MTKIKIYHNNRCSKSRQGLSILEDSKTDFEIINYLVTPPTVKELKNLLKMLGFTPIQLVRKGETIWKENYKGKDLTDSELITAMIKNPKLIERPIVVKENKAVIGRPLENITLLISSKS